MKIILIILLSAAIFFVIFSVGIALSKAQAIRDRCYRQTIAASQTWADQSLLQDFKPYQECISRGGK